MVRNTKSVRIGDRERDENGNLPLDTLFCLDILRFPVEPKGRPFRFTELANWLLENNSQLRNELQSSHYTKSYKLHSKTSFIAARLDRLIDAGFIEIAGNIEAEKNKVAIPLYRFTRSGLIRLHQSQSRTSGNVAPVDNSIIEATKTLLSGNSEDKLYSILLDSLSSEPVFLLEFAQNLDSWRNQVFLFFFPWLDEGGPDGFKQTGNTGSMVYSENVKRIILETFYNLDKTMQKMILFQTKRGMEEYFCWSRPSMEYELQCLANADNLQQAVVQVTCEACNAVSPMLINIEQLLGRHIGTVDESHRFSCPKCCKENSCQLSTAIVN